MSTFQYWRLNFNGVTNGSSLVAIAEWQFFDGNLAAVSTSGGTSSASSTFATVTTANAFDGDINTLWASNANPSSGSPQWLQMQFTGAVTVAFIKVTIRNDITWASQSPTAFQVQGSPDGTTWTTLKTYTGIVWGLNGGVGESQFFDASTVVGAARVSTAIIEMTTIPTSSARLSQLAVESVGGSNPHIVLSQLAVETLGGSNPHILLSQLAVEVVYPFVQPTPQVIMEMILP